jgi:hypothetical protein
MARLRGRLVRGRLGAPAALGRHLGEGARITLAGRLEARGAACPSFEDGAPVAASTIAARRGSRGGGAVDRGAIDVRAEELVLVTDDGVRVPLEGPVQVVAGARESWPGRRLGSLSVDVCSRIAVAAAPVERSEALASRVVVMRALRGGDRVRAAGWLVMRSSADAGAQVAYRSPAGRWVLAGEARGAAEAEVRAPLSLAHEGRPHVRGPGWRALIAAALVSLATALSGLVVAGGLALVQFDEEEAALCAFGGCACLPDARRLDAAVFAAATPFHREEALERIAEALRLMCHQDERLVALRLALAELRGRPWEAAEILLDHQAFERAARAAEAGGDDRIASEAWLAAGRYVEASDAEARGRSGVPAYGPGGVTVAAHLLAGKTERAAATARLLSASLRVTDGGDRDGRNDDRAPDALSCLADSIDLQGAPEGLRGIAADRLADAAEDGAAWRECALLRGALMPVGERADALARLLREGRADGSAPADPWAAPLRDAACLLVLPETPDHPCGAELRLDERLAAAPEELLLWGHDKLGGAQPALEAALLARLEMIEAPTAAELTLRAQVGGVVAMAASLAGRGDDARRAAVWAAADLEDAAAALGEEPADLPARRAALMALRAAIALRDGDAADAGAVLDEGTLPGPASDVARLLAFEERGEVEVIASIEDTSPLAARGDLEGWTRAAGGDAAAAVAWLETAPTYDRSWLLLGAPRIHPAERAAAWLRWGDRLDYLRLDVRWLVGRVGDRAAVARALGDTQLAAELDAILARHRAAMMKTELAVPLLVLDGL